MSSHSYIDNPKNKNIFININGELFVRDQAKISVFDSGFLLGDGSLGRYKIFIIQIFSFY